MSTLMVYYNNMGNSSYALENSVTGYGREISYTNIKKGKVIPPSEGMTLLFLFGSCAILVCQHMGKEVSMEPRLTLYTEGKYYFIRPQDIFCVNGDGAYTKIHTTEGMLRVSKNLKTLLETLPESCKTHLLRIHKGWVINTNKIYSVDLKLGQGSVAVLTNGMELPIGRHYKSGIRDLITTSAAAEYKH